MTEGLNQQQVEYLPCITLLDLILSEELFALHWVGFFWIYFWLHWIFIASWAFSSCCELFIECFIDCCSSSKCLGFSLWWFLLLQSTGSRHMGLVAPHVKSSQIRDRTHVPCIGRQILISSTTREVPWVGFYRCNDMDIHLVYMLKYVIVHSQNGGWVTCGYTGS